MNSIDYEVNLLSKLVEVDTNALTKEGYDDCASIIVEEAKKFSLDVQVSNGKKVSEDGLSRPNVIVTLDSGSDTTLLLESHFDVVPPGEPWSRPPFKLTIENGKAFGRGASDNKAGVAASLGALRRLLEEDLDINVKLIASVDEEVGGRCGIEHVLRDCGLRGDAALVVDSGPESIFVGASGIMWGKIIVKGRQGHAGYPFNSKNAIKEALRLISEFEAYQKIVEEKESKVAAPPNSPRDKVWGRFSVTMIKAWEKENIIPGTCEIRFDQRLIPEEPLESAEEELSAFFEAAKEKTGCEASLEITSRLLGYLTPIDHVFVQTVSKVVKRTLGEPVPIAGELGGNDGSFFAKNGIPVVCFGPIRSDTSFHGTDEFVHLQDLKDVRDMIFNLGKARRGEIKSR